MNIEICADDIEGEAVVRRGIRNREWTRMDANAGARLAPCSGSVSASLRCNLAEAKGERRACRAVALAKAGRVSSRKSLISMIVSDNFNRFLETFGGIGPFGVKSGFGAEVVDFRGFSRYFSIVADISHAFFPNAWRKFSEVHAVALLIYL